MKVKNALSAPGLAVGDQRAPFWSVMIPAYNPSVDYLEQTLRCVLAQDPGPEQMQIEVVDDCSPAVDVAARVREIAGDRITVFRGPLNQGLAGCWNTCIERACGEWVHILHQDDLIYPGFYESLRRGITANPQVGAAYTRHAYCDENNHWDRLSRLERSSPGVLPRFVEPLVTAERIQCAAIAVRREVYARIGGFNPELTHALDWEMWIRIANQFPIFYEPGILACWRNHSNATTSKQIRSGENIRDIAKAIGIWSQYLPVDEGHRLSLMARNRFAEAGLGLSRMLSAQNDIEGCHNQAAATLICKCTIGMRLKVIDIKLRVIRKKLLRRLKSARIAAASKASQVG